MRAVDTNVVVRLITRDDARQLAAAEAYVAKGAWISLVVLVEVTWVLESVYELAPERIADAVEMMLRHGQLTVEDPATASQAVELFRGRPALGFSDCLVLSTAKRAGHTPLGTFDRELSKCSGAERV